MQVVDNSEYCRKCGSAVIAFNFSFGFYRCNACGGTWGYDKDDPDYEELVTANCPFFTSQGCSNGRQDYPRCDDCPRRNVN